MAYVISFDLKIFEKNTKFNFEDTNKNNSLISMVMEENKERIAILEAIPT